MNPATVLIISQGIGEAMRLGLRGYDLIQQLADGTLTDDEASAAWSRAQGEYRAGRDAWDAAGEPDDAA